MTSQKQTAEYSAKLNVRKMQALDGALAMKEYRAELLAVQAKTERLRALRIANETRIAAQGKPAAIAPAKGKSRVRRRRAT